MEDSADRPILRDLTSREAVLTAMREYDDVGRNDFLSEYRFGQATQYMVVHEDRLYDPKAIAGLFAHAHQYRKGPFLRPRDFTGGISSGAVGPKLESLGFRVGRRWRPRPWPGQGARRYS